jgi:hypothetical protein
MSRRIIAIAAFCLTTSVIPVRADKIDGDWCLGNRHFSIAGPQITTPAGRTLKGNYSRHAYSYEPPADDPEHGQIVLMQLLNEETVRLVRKREDQLGAPETWHRCQVIS